MFGLFFPFRSFRIIIRFLTFRFIPFTLGLWPFAFGLGALTLRFRLLTFAIRLFLWRNSFRARLDFLFRFWFGLWHRLRSFFIFSLSRFRSYFLFLFYFWLSLYFLLDTSTLLLLVFGITLSLLILCRFRWFVFRLTLSLLVLSCFCWPFIALR